MEEPSKSSESTRLDMELLLYVTERNKVLMLRFLAHNV